MKNLKKIPKNLLENAYELGINDHELEMAYRKGFLAWIPGAVPGSTPEQLGMVVVEEYIKIKQEKLMEAQQEKRNIQQEDPVPVDDDDKKTSKKPKSYKAFAKDSKYSNKQPGPLAPSGRMAGAGANWYQTEELPNNANIRAWVLSEKTQQEFTKRYGNKAREKLLEAAKRIHTSLVLKG